MLIRYNLITIAIITFIIFLFISLGVMYLLKPAWIQKMNMKTGKYSICWSLAFSYSLAFASFSAVVVMLILSKYKKEKPMKTYKIDIPVPSEILAESYPNE